MLSGYRNKAIILHPVHTYDLLKVTFSDYTNDINIFFILRTHTALVKEQNYCQNCLFSDVYTIAANQNTLLCSYVLLFQVLQVGLT